MATRIRMSLKLKKNEIRVKFRAHFHCQDKVTETEFCSLIKC